MYFEIPNKTTGSYFKSTGYPCPDPLESPPPTAKGVAEPYDRCISRYNKKGSIKGGRWRGTTWRQTTTRSSPTGPHSESSQQAADVDLPKELTLSLPDLSIRPSEASPRPGKSQSPRKRSDMNLDQTRTNANITLAFLETCKPGVQLLSYDDIRTSPAVRAQMSTSVESLQKRLERIPNGPIQSELKSAFETDASTPRKKKDAPPADVYLEAGTTLYPQDSLGRLKTVVSRVVMDAMWNHKSGAHERQWGKSVVQIISKFELWPRGEEVKLLNLERYTINLVEFWPTTSSGAPLALEGDSEIASATSAA